MIFIKDRGGTEPTNLVFLNLKEYMNNPNTRSNSTRVFTEKRKLNSISSSISGSNSNNEATSTNRSVIKKARNTVNQNAKITISGNSGNSTNTSMGQPLRKNQKPNNEVTSAFAKMRNLTPKFVMGTKPKNIKKSPFPSTMYRRKVTEPQTTVLNPKGCTRSYNNNNNN